MEEERCKHGFDRHFCGICQGYRGSSEGPPWTMAYNPPSGPAEDQTNKELYVIGSGLREKDSFWDLKYYLRRLNFRQRRYPEEKKPTWKQFVPKYFERCIDFPNLSKQQNILVHSHYLGSFGKKEYHPPYRVEELARAYKMPVGTIKKNIQRAKNKIIDYLDWPDKQAPEAIFLKTLKGFVEDKKQKANNKAVDESEISARPKYKRPARGPLI